MLSALLSTTTPSSRCKTIVTGSTMRSSSGRRSSAGHSGDSWNCSTRVLNKRIPRHNTTPMDGRYRRALSMANKRLTRVPPPSTARPSKPTARRQGSPWLGHAQQASTTTSTMLHRSRRTTASPGSHCRQRQVSPPAAAAAADWPARQRRRRRRRPLAGAGPRLCHRGRGPRYLVRRWDAGWPRRSYGGRGLLGERPWVAVVDRGQGGKGDRALEEIIGKTRGTKPEHGLHGKSGAAENPEENQEQSTGGNHQ
mmetsp:Transcript_23628/g.52041  ORF Transcript_23628/g.52041 Transcript_23628/m.52041 type:complete len:253 (-) Transcript_23628:6-764(-)